MLIRVELATPDVDPREPVGSALRQPTYFWIEHTAVISVQDNPNGKFRMLLGNGMHVQCVGQAADVARRVNLYHRAYMRNPEVLAAANES